MEKSWCYKKGFGKGIEIYNQNANSGYYGDKTIEKIYLNSLEYADTGMKNGTALNQNQVDYYYGLADGIKYRCSQSGIYLPYKRLSTFEINEYEHCYSKKPDKIYF